MKGGAAYLKAGSFRLPQEETVEFLETSRLFDPRKTLHFIHRLSLTSLLQTSQVLIH